MKKYISEVSHCNFDIIIIGGGINGACAAQKLTGAGYKVLLVEKNDFASAASRMSSRLLHCGLRYLDFRQSIWSVLSNPYKQIVSSKMAINAMKARSQMVLTTPERVRKINLCVPIWKSSKYSEWQINVAFGFLKYLGDRSVPLGKKIIKHNINHDFPFFEYIRDKADLQSALEYGEYQIDWPERLCVDAVLDAEKNGASAFNYVEAIKIKYKDGNWEVLIKDRVSLEEVIVRSKAVVNASGMWVDDIAGKMLSSCNRRRVFGTKGTNILVRLPKRLENHGIVSKNRMGEPLYCIPWQGMHYIGPTETKFEGDNDEIKPREEEVSLLLEEFNYIFPRLRLKRDDVVFSWSGVRPLTYSGASGYGVRECKVIDEPSSSMPGFFSVTGGPIMTARLTANSVLKNVRKYLAPSGDGSQISYRSRNIEINDNQLNFHPICKEEVMREVVFSSRNEHVVYLKDLMFSRLGLAWGPSMGVDIVDEVANVAGRELGWSECRISEEIKHYIQYLEEYHLYSGA